MGLSIAPKGRENMPKATILGNGATPERRLHATGHVLMDNVVSRCWLTVKMSVNHIKAIVILTWSELLLEARTGRSERVADHSGYTHAAGQTSLAGFESTSHKTMFFMITR